MEANEAEGNEDDQFATSYNKIKEIVTQNPEITAEKFDEELTKKEIDKEITNQDGWPLLYYAVRSEGPYIIGDRSIFLNIIGLLTNLNTEIHFKDTASKTALDMAAITKQADVVAVLLGSGKFNEEAKLHALHSAIVQGNVQEARSFLDHINNESMKAALEIAMQNGQEEITQVLINFITPGTSNVEENRAKPCSSNGNIGDSPVPLGSTNGDNHNNKNETPVLTANGQTTTPNRDNKKSQRDFYTSLKEDFVGVVVTGLFIATAVMVPSVAGAVVCGIVAALIAIATVLHAKNSTLPNYSKMEEIQLKSSQEKNIR